MHDVVVRFDLCEVDGVTESGGLEQIARVVPQHRHLAEFASVALEVAVIDGIEPRQRGEQAHIGFGDGVAHQETLPGKTFGEPVEASEQRVVCLVVSLL